MASPDSSRLREHPDSDLGARGLAQALRGFGRAYGSGDAQALDGLAGHVGNQVEVFV